MKRPFQGSLLTCLRRTPLHQYETPRHKEVEVLFDKAEATAEEVQGPEDLRFRDSGFGFRV